MAKKKNPKQAAGSNEQGLAHYRNWEMEQAIAAFQAAADADPDNPEYHLNLARAYARSSDYHHAMTALGAYLQVETEEQVAERYERLFSSALDEVETVLIDTLRQQELPLQQIGKAMQMWLEYRITLGRQTLRLAKPELWAAALTHAIIKVNFGQQKLADVAGMFGVSERAVRERYQELVETLDIMPADYRYFVGEENPLDKLVEAARVLEDLDRQFREE